MNMAATINRKAKFAVINTKQLRAINPLDDREVVEAQSDVSKEMIAALEEMVNAAKSGRLAGDEVLAMSAVAWTNTSL
jgi:hypothetical protein